MMVILQTGGHPQVIITSSNQFHFVVPNLYPFVRSLKKYVRATGTPTPFIEELLIRYEILYIM